MLETLGFCVGALGLIVAIYQTISARNAKKIHRDSCRVRCRDASHKTLRLSDNVVALCGSLTRPEVQAILVSKPDTAINYAAIHSNLGATIDVAKDLVRFCERLNEDHRHQFGEDAIAASELEALNDVRSCLIGADRETELMLATPAERPPGEAA